jgi:tetratricopeptide (TPR) repeat protein
MKNSWSRVVWIFIVAVVAASVLVWWRFGTSSLPTVNSLLSTPANSAPKTVDEFIDSFADTPPTISPADQDRYRDKIQQLKSSLAGSGASLTGETLENTRVTLGFSYQQIGKNKEALGIYRDMLKTDQNNFIALNNSADIFERVGKYKEANAFYARIIAKMPDDAQTIQKMMNNAFRLNDITEANRVLDNFAAQYWNDPKAQPIIINLRKEILEYQRRRTESPNMTGKAIDVSLGGGK